MSEPKFLSIGNRFRLRDELFSGKVSLILNTNGTTKLLGDFVPLLKESGALIN